MDRLLLFFHFLKKKKNPTIHDMVHDMIHFNTMNNLRYDFDFQNNDWSWVTEGMDCSWMSSI